MATRDTNRSSNSVFKYITQNVIYAISFSVIFSFLLMAILSWMLLHPKERDFYITFNAPRDKFITKNWQRPGTLKIQQLDEPNLSDTSVVQWANEAIIDLYTYDFFNYRKQVYSKRRFFLYKGWASFIKGLKSSGIIKEIRDKKLRVSAIVVKQALLQRKGPILGVYSWSIKLPVLVNFESASESRQQRYLARMIVQRRSPLHDARGIGIASIMITPVGK
jgi:intracellular multiplication protein IcmL